MLNKALSGVIGTLALVAKSFAVILAVRIISDAIIMFTGSGLQGESPDVD